MRKRKSSRLACRKTVGARRRSELFRIRAYHQSPAAQHACNPEPCIVPSAIDRIVSGAVATEGRIWREAYDSDPAIIYALDQDLRLIRCNPAWDRFARDNGKAELTGSRVLGTCIMDVTPNVLQDFYSTVYDSVRKFQRQWWHVFDCSSSDVFRAFQMRVLPAAADCILVVNTLIREEPHEPQIAARIEAYTDADGIATICANCRRVEHLTQPGRWDWIPLLLNLSGTLVQPSLCPFCHAYHYPKH